MRPADCPDVIFARPGRSPSNDATRNALTLMALPPTRHGVTTELFLRLVMRRAVSGDIGSIEKLLDQAFAPSRFESSLVKGLVLNGRNIHHWLLEQDRQLLAYVCYSQAYRRGTEPIGWHLAPVAVRPEWQRKGHGSELIRHTLAQFPISGRPVFVLGDPGYYARFGFSRIREPHCPYDLSNEHFMALRYTGRESFMIGYEREFNGGAAVV